MKRLICVMLSLTVFLSGCYQLPAQQEEKQYTATFLNLFDTVTTIVGKAESKEAFEAEARQVHDELLIEAYKPELEIVETILREEMEQAASLDVPLEIDMHTGENWYEAK